MLGLIVRLTLVGEALYLTVSVIAMYNNAPSYHCYAPLPPNGADEDFMGF